MQDIDRTLYMSLHRHVRYDGWLRSNERICLHVDDLMGKSLRPIRWAPLRGSQRACPRPESRWPAGLTAELARPRPQPVGQQPRVLRARVLRRSHCVRTHRLAATALSYPECDEAREDERGQSIGRRGRVAKTILWHGALSISSSSLVIAEPALGNVH